MTKKHPLVNRPWSERNNKLYDGWSLIHLATGILLGWVLSPIVALLILILWEPLEILVLSPLFARIDIDFGFETLKNSLSDIVIDIVAVMIGYYLLTHFAQPPFHLF
jgi:hypothetical protein